MSETPGFVPTETRDCRTCGEPFIPLIPEDLPMGNLWRDLATPKHCPACVYRMEEESNRLEQEKKLRERTEFWERNCPPLYQDTDPEKLIHKGIPRETVEAVLDFPFSSRGLGLVGPSRKGKTRLMFSLIRRYAIEDGKGFCYVNMVIFADKLASLYSKSSQDADEYMSRLEGASVLFLDDIGKERLTDRVESALYRLIEVRSSYLRPVYFTANMTGREMLEKMTDREGNISDRAVPIVERLREFCEVLAL